MKQWMFPLVLAGLLTACSGTPKPADEPTTGPAAQEAVQQEEVVKEDPIDIYVRNNAERLANFAMRFANASDLPKEIKAALDDEAFKKNKTFLQPEDLKSVYEGRQYAPIFVSNGAISDDFKPLTDEFGQLERHGLKPATGLFEAIEGLGKDRETPEKFVFTEDELKILADTIRDRKVDVTSNEAVRDLISDLVRDENTLPRLYKTVRERAMNAAVTAKQEALTEVLAADQAMRFARSMAFENMTHLTDEETASLGKYPSDAKYAAIAQKRTKAWFDELVRVADSLGSKGKAEAEAETEAAPEVEETEVAEIDDSKLDEAKDAHKAEIEAANAQKARLHNAASVAELVEALYPPHPAYKQLMEAHDRYASLEDWKDVPSIPLKAGKSHKNMPQLRKRLAAEGYYHGDISEEALKAPEAEVYDDDLRAAVRLYHETHQLAYDEQKGIAKAFWESLNTPRKKRLEQIDENLRRWHKTQIIPSPYYILINVPDFHGEVWRDGARTYRFPVVVGNAGRACDPQTKQWKLINATPLQHARMLYIEYNPYWIVPPRIEQEDYIEKINSDPTWLETHGFEYHTEGGHTVLRQLPSENNALGRVKFIFPNPHSTFLHDSPKKGLFKYPIRAFSHGCMRVWEPLKLAKLLLQYDGQWKDRIEKDIEDLQPHRFILKNRFDVFIDYFTVRVDDEGIVNFLADPYRYVKNVLEPPKASELSCKPNPRAWVARKPAGADPGADEP